MPKTLTNQALKRLQALEVLKLDRNQFQTLPSEITQPNALKDLDLSNNQLESVPSELGKLEELTDLSLAYN